MSLISPTPTIPSNLDEPAWEIAMLFPDQGHWSAEEYLSISERTNRLVELTNGKVEVLDMPGKTHQQIGKAIIKELDRFLEASPMGEALIAPYPMKISEETFREPDIVFVLRENSARLTECFADGADLVMEVISKDRKRDLVIKRAEYAAAGVSEYWLIDPRDTRITVLKRQGDQYIEYGQWGTGQRADSDLLNGFSVDVDTILNQ